MTIDPASQALDDAEWIEDGSVIGVRRVVVGSLDTNCWALFSITGDEPSRIIDATSDLDIRAVVLTHSHWDHVLALPEVADQWWADVLLSPRRHRRMAARATPPRHPRPLRRRHRHLTTRVGQPCSRSQT